MKLKKIIRLLNEGGQAITWFDVEKASAKKVAKIKKAMLEAANRLTDDRVEELVHATPPRNRVEEAKKKVPATKTHPLSDILALGAETFGCDPTEEAVLSAMVADEISGVKVGGVARRDPATKHPDIMKLLGSTKASRIIADAYAAARANPKPRGKSASIGAAKTTHPPLPNIFEAITEYCGPRCPDFEPGCPTCEAWAEYDALTGGTSPASEPKICDALEIQCPQPSLCVGQCAARE